MKNTNQFTIREDLATQTISYSSTDENKYRLTFWPKVYSKPTVLVELSSSKVAFLCHSRPFSRGVPFASLVRKNFVLPPTSILWGLRFPFARFEVMLGYYQPHLRRNSIVATSDRCRVSYCVSPGCLVENQDPGTNKPQAQFEFRSAWVHLSAHDLIFGDNPKQKITSLCLDPFSVVIFSKWPIVWISKIHHPMEMEILLFVRDQIMCRRKTSQQTPSRAILPLVREKSRATILLRHHLCQIQTYRQLPSYTNKNRSINRNFFAVFKRRFRLARQGSTGICRDGEPFEDNESGK